MVGVGDGDVSDAGLRQILHPCDVQRAVSASPERDAAPRLQLLGVGHDQRFSLEIVDVADIGRC
jgi:hypothetical protein